VGATPKFPRSRFDYPLRISPNDIVIDDCKAFEITRDYDVVYGMVYHVSFRCKNGESNNVDMWLQYIAPRSEPFALAFRKEGMME
jgi:hypothetical protein